MFEPSDGPRVFGLPPGVEFPRALIDGLAARLAGAPPEVWGRVEIFVNTRRMQRRIMALFDAGPPRLLPRIRVVTDLAAEAALDDIPPAVPALRRRLELAQLVAKLLDLEPDLAPRSALFDLADSLAALMDEMRGEGVSPEALRRLDVADFSAHWQRGLKFVTLVERYFGADGAQAPDPEARQRMVIEHLARRWKTAPPDYPVIVAGSTGSRGATAEFMGAVAALPQGAVILPGVDFDMPDAMWNRLESALTGEDHPQFRFVRLMAGLDRHPREIRPWLAEAAPPCAARNRLVSLALRPAPVTDQWLTEGRRLSGIGAATEAMTLIEAPSSRAEANAIALALRRAVEDGVTAALITPDRTLTRQVTAALDRWGIVPDDSAGRPLPLSPPGRYLRQVADLFGQVLTVEALLALLKHPLTCSGGDRGAHLLHTRDLELSLRRHGPPFPVKADLLRWAADDAGRTAWAGWIGAAVDGLAELGTRALSDHLDHHLRLAETLAAGPAGVGSGELWERAGGVEAQRRVAELQRESEHGGALTPLDYQTLFHGVLQRGEVREPVQPHPGVMIWGTLEARVQGADLVILGGLNEGVWPEMPGADPWLNRAMRSRVGLLLPERRIGLAAHDFQQAVAAKEVMLTRAVRDAEAQTVPSRWLNRLCNLLAGLPEEGAPALGAMRKRGEVWLGLAEALDAPRSPVPAEPRPAPAPPAAARPRRISITEVQKLIRDPYAAYARRVLRLDPLDPLRRRPDPPLRGTVIHRIMERFVGEGPFAGAEAAKARLVAVADAVLAEHAPWPAARLLWRARLLRVADWLIETEIERQAMGTVAALEQTARMRLPGSDHELYGKIDRIDRLADGGLAIYDYKAGKPPTENVQKHFDKQLLLSALLAESGGVTGLDPAPVRLVGYIGLGGVGQFDPVTPEPGEVQATLAGLMSLLAAYADAARGYASRRAVDQTRFAGDYDHLARYGEWDESFGPVTLPVG